MGKVHPVAGLLDDRPGRLVHVCAGDTGSRGGTAGGVGILDDLVDLLILIIHITDGKRAGQVGDVAIKCCTPVHDEQVTGLQPALCRRGMRVGRVRSSGNDRGERQLWLGAVFEQLRYQLGGQLFFGHANPDEWNDRLEGILGDLHGLAHPFDFSGILAQAKVREQSACIGEICFGRAVLDVAKFQQAQLARLDADSFPVQPERLRGLSK